MLLLLEVINQQTKIIQGLIVMLCTQNPKEPTDLRKMQVIMTIKVLKFAESQDKVENRMENKNNNMKVEIYIQ